MQKRCVGPSLRSRRQVGQVEQVRQEAYEDVYAGRWQAGDQLKGVAEMETTREVRARLGVTYAVATLVAAGA